MPEYIVFGTGEPGYVPSLAGDNAFTGTNTFAKKITVTDTSNQLQLLADASNHLLISVGATGGVDLTATGVDESFTFNDLLKSKGETRLGTDANYVKVSSAGDFSLVGDATQWEDIRIEPVARTTGSNAPSFEKYFDDVAGTSRGVYLYSFDDASGGSEKEVHFTMQMPHAWALSSISMHVHWVGNVSDTTSDPRWGLEYTWMSVGGTYGDTTTIYSDGTHITLSGADANITAGKHYITEFADISPSTTANTVSSILIGRIFRDSANAGDTYDAATNKCGLLYVDAHYEVNSLGSRTEYGK